MKLGVLASHPVQYQAPIFRELAAMTDLVVFHAHRQSAQGQAEAGYGVAFDWDVDILSGYRHIPLENVSRQPGTGHFSGCDTPGIGAALDAEAVDVLLVMGWNLKSYWQAVLACRRRGIPVMVRGDSQLGTQRVFWRRLLKRALYPVMLRQFDRLLHVGRRNQEYLMHYGCAPARLHFAPHCVDNERFASAAARARVEGARAELGLAEDDRVILFVGRMVAGKRPDDLLAALELLQQRDPSCRLVALMAGDGELRPTLAARAEASGLRVLWAGFRNQSRLPAVYAAADLLVLPSDAGETWGLVVNEAMACGLPCVVSDACGCAPDMVSPGISGETYPVGDVAALADAITRCLARCRDAAALRTHVAQHAPVMTARGILEAARAALAERAA